MRRSASTRDGGSITEIIETKIRAAKAPAGTIPRPTLASRLAAGLTGRLTLLSAHAGSGKTTLLREALVGSDRRVAWLSLDEDDNDPVRFWRYVVAALREAGCDDTDRALRLLRSAQGSTRPAIAAIVNSLARLDEPCVLVLDDYHLVESADVHRDVGLLVDHLPPQAHVVLATRADPPLPLSRLRARGELTEFRAVDLGFGEEEAAALLNGSMGLGLDSGLIAALVERTEGWAAGLHLAGLSLAGTCDPKGFVATFSASNRYILDYLSEEVFVRLDEALGTFLLQTSVLDRLSAPLCDAVTGTTGSADMIRRIEEANLFLQPLDEERRWYRYHSLFADLLRARLARRDPDLLPELHARASRWFGDAGYPMEAAHHALAGGEPARAADLMESVAEGLTLGGQGSTVRHWTASLPDDVLVTHPMLAVWGSWAEFLRGRLDEAQRLAQLAETSAAERVARGDGSDDANVLAGTVLGLQAFLSRARGDIELSLEQSRTALGRLGPAETLFRGLVTFNLAVLHTFVGHIDTARRLGEEALDHARESPTFWDDAVISSHLARVAINNGRLREGERIARQIIEEGLDLSGGAPLPVLGHAYTALGNVLYEWNRLVEAAEAYDQAVALGEGAGEIAAVLGGLAGRARVLFAEGEHAAATQAVARAARATPPGLAPWLKPYLESWRARLALAEGDLATATGWADRWFAARTDDRGRLPAPSSVEIPALMNAVRIRLVARNARGLTAVLRTAARSVETEGRTGMLIEALVVLALALEAEERTDEALATLDRVLSKGEPEGYTRTYLDEGEPLARLLRISASRGRGGSEVGRLLAEFSRSAGDETMQTHALSARRRRAAELGRPEPPAPLLSERELEVLNLLARGLSNREIAGELYLAEGTVKKHVYNICTKLGAARRTQAVARGRELGLL